MELPDLADLDGPSEADEADSTAIAGPQLTSMLASGLRSQPPSPAPEEDSDADFALDSLLRDAAPKKAASSDDNTRGTARPGAVDFADEITRDGEQPLDDLKPRSTPPPLPVAPAPAPAVAAPPRAASALDDLDALIVRRKDEELVGDHEIMDVDDNELSTSIGRSPMAADSEDEVMIADDFDDVEMLDDDDHPRR